jgi:predicted Zn-dependent protease
MDDNNRHNDSTIRLDRVEQLRKLVQAGQGDHLVNYLLGVELNKVHDYAAAAEALERARQLNPRHSATWRHLGDALRLAGRHAEAMAIYREGITVAEETGELQTAKEMGVFLRKLEGARGGGD